MTQPMVRHDGRTPKTSGAIASWRKVSSVMTHLLNNICTVVRHDARKAPSQRTFVQPLYCGPSRRNIWCVLTERRHPRSLVASRVVRHGAPYGASWRTTRCLPVNPDSKYVFHRFENDRSWNLFMIIPRYSQSSYDWSLVNSLVILIEIPFQSPIFMQTDATFANPCV